MCSDGTPSVAVNDCNVGEECSTPGTFCSPLNSGGQVCCPREKRYLSLKENYEAFHPELKLPQPTPNIG